MSFSKDQIDRYSRHIVLEEIGIGGQKKIGSAKVLVIGLGGLGAPAALYLAAAGIGRIGLADGDRVDMSNLQRQVLHFTDDIGTPKVFSAAEKLKKLNPDVDTVCHNTFVNADNISELIKGYDFIIDGTDNLETKFLINDAAVLAGKPFSHGGIRQFEGITFTHTPGNACCRCLFPVEPDREAGASCAEAGVLGAIAGMLGTMQAAEALKFTAGFGDLLTNRLYIFNAKQGRFKTVAIKPDAGCPLCGENPSITALFAKQNSGTADKSSA